jgi:hypothetical protein
LSKWHQALAWWLATRAVIFLAWWLAGVSTQGDVDYYYRSINSLFEGRPASETLVEYPTPLIWVLCLPYLLGGGARLGFRAAFICLFLLTDALVAWALWRTAHRYGTSPRPALLFWIAFAPAMGTTTYMRLDLLTAALGAAAVLALVRSHRFTSGVMIGLGAGFKLWPALLWPATLADRRAVKRATLGVAVTGAGLVLLSWWYAGLDRLLSPLTWQSDRGLQIESIYATPFMVARLFAPDSYPVAMSKYQAFEVAGRGTVALTEIATTATLAGGLLMVALYIGWLRRPDRTPIEAGTLMIIATLVMIVTNKTFSPQYMVWLAGPVAGLLTISARRPSQPLAVGAPALPLSLARRIAWWVIALTAATQLVYPVFYDFLVRFRWGAYIGTPILAARNVALVYFTVRLIILAVRSIAWPQFFSKPAAASQAALAVAAPATEAQTRPKRRKRPDRSTT